MGRAIDGMRIQAIIVRLFGMQIPIWSQWPQFFRGVDELVDRYEVDLTSAHHSIVIPKFRGGESDHPMCGRDDATPADRDCDISMRPAMSVPQPFPPKSARLLISLPMVRFATENRQGYYPGEQLAVATGENS